MGSTLRSKASRRGYWTLLQRGGIGLLLAAVVAVGLVATAGAAPPASGDIVPTAATPQAGFTAGIPFASGQNINVVVPANSAFAGSHLAVNVVECAAPNGVVPTTPSACDGNTIQGNSILPSFTDGSFTYTGYTLYALPDSVSLGETPGGPACGQTAATECILYIGQNQNDFTQPHLWSAPFFIAPNATDAGTPAGDGSAPTAATKPDAGASTAVASPSTLTADGADPSTVTVTLQDTHNQPFSGKTVTLSATSCTPSPCAASLHITGPNPAQSDSGGQTKFTVTDGTAQAVTLTATDTSDSVTLIQKPVVTFQAPVVSPTHSSVVASPTTVPSGSTTITVTLRDQAANPQPVVGHTVSLVTTGSAVISPGGATGVTNAQGVATFTATDAVAETVTFSATDTTATVPLTGTASVTFGTLSVDASKSTLTVSSPAPVGASGTTAVVTLLTSTGSPVAGKQVTLAAASGTSAVIGTPNPATTGANGQATFSVTDPTAESVQLTATDTTDNNLQLSSKPSVVFQNGAPSPSASTVLAAATTSPADGETQTLITVKMTDQFGHPLSDKTISLAAVPSENIQIHPISVGSASPGVTDSTGVAEFEASDSVAESVTVTATDTSDNNLVLSQTVTITYTAGPADPIAQGSTVTASPTNPPADGTTTTTITVTLTDYFSNPVAGTTISLKALNGSATIANPSGVTNQAGQVAFTATDSKAEVVTFQATDVTDKNTVFPSQAVVTFGNPPAPPPSAAFCSVVATPSNVPADGTHTASVSVLLYDANGGPVTGKTVSLTSSGGSSKVAATNATSNNSGMATFAVSDSTAEAVKFTAHDTTDSIDLTAAPVTVTFTPAAAGSGTTTTTTTSPTGTTGTTTTTTPAAGVTPVSTSTSTSGGASGGTTGNSGASVSTTASLASTGAPTLLPWLVGSGGLFLVIGTIGRRRVVRVHERNGQ